MAGSNKITTGLGTYTVYEDASAEGAGVRVGVNVIPSGPNGQWQAGYVAGKSAIADSLSRNTGDSISNDEGFQVNFPYPGAESFVRAGVAVVAGTNYSFGDTGVEAISGSQTASLVALTSGNAGSTVKVKFL
ncbi:MAG: hypothetical protein HAW67_00210 [Endozoicomonadaceae bacterium]|nr:hypothetical protein [Endozoicomonadaceae bacterium]